MRVDLFPAPWIQPELTKETEEAIEIIGDDIWRDASIRFTAAREYMLNTGKRAPKGMQRYLNEVFNARFTNKGWYSDSGYYFKEQTWIRVTFRHQMSLGSDILDALKVCKFEGMKQAIICVADGETLNLISPNDATALVSFDKLYNDPNSQLFITRPLHLLRQAPPHPRHLPTFPSSHT